MSFYIQQVSYTLPQLLLRCELQNDMNYEILKGFYWTIQGTRMHFVSEFGWTA